VLPSLSAISLLFATLSFPPILNKSHPQFTILSRLSTPNSHAPYNAVFLRLFLLSAFLENKF
jgi:hypothetical protein